MQSCISLSKFVRGNHFGPFDMTRPHGPLQRRGDGWREGGISLFVDLAFESLREADDTVGVTLIGFGVNFGRAGLRLAKRLPSKSQTVHPAGTKKTRIGDTTARSPVSTGWDGSVRLDLVVCASAADVGVNHIECV